MGLEGQRADGSATTLVNAPSFQLQDGRAKVPERLRLSIHLEQSCAPTNDQVQTRTNDGSYSCYSSPAFSGVADGRIAGAGDDCPVLAGDRP